MAKLLKVIKVEIRETVSESIRKSKRHDYARGGFKIEEVIYRTTIAKPFALLECGHWREEQNHGAAISKAESLSCRVCEQAEWDRLKENH